MKTIDELITEHAKRITKAHLDRTFGDYTSEGLLASYTLDLIDNGHIAPREDPRERN